MSKKFPEDMDYRKALPCEYCGVDVECFNVTTKYIGCPNCEREQDHSRAIMRFENIKLEDQKSIGFIAKTHAELWAGPELIMSGLIKDILKEKYTIQRVNYNPKNEKYITGVLRFEDIRLKQSGLYAKLFDGKKFVIGGFMKSLLREIKNKKYVVEGVNYSPYNEALKKRRPELF